MKAAAFTYFIYTEYANGDSPRISKPERLLRCASRIPISQDVEPFDFRKDVEAPDSFLIQDNSPYPREFGGAGAISLP